MRNLLFLPLLLAALPARAQFSASNDLTITGQTGVGTAVPQARMEIKLSSADAYALKVSSPNGDALLVVDKAGQMGIGLASPGALLDVNGRGDASDLGLQLRAGNSTSSITSSQIVFAYDSSGTYRHSLRTRATAGQNFGNAIDFYLWNSTGAPTSLGDVNILSLQAVPRASTAASVHIYPSTSAPAYELVVSNGLTTGGGTVMAANVSAHSRRSLKGDISYLDEATERRAYEEVKGLRHARFRYKANGPNAPLIRGLIYEDAPESIRSAPGKSIILENRLVNMELALKSTYRRIAALEAKISDMEKGK
jgi:hypothetical protein